MRVPKIRLGSLMFTVVFVGIFLAEVRAMLAFDNAPIANGNLIAFTAPLLVVGNFLAYLLTFRLPEAWRTGRLRAVPFWWGFQATSWGAFMAYCLICLAAGDGLFMEHVWPPGSTIGSVLTTADALLPQSKGLESIFEFGLMTILFGVPILALGLLGGAAAWATGIEVEVQFRRRKPIE